MTDAKSIVKQAGALIDRVVPPPPGITILIYHRVGGGTDSDVDLDPALFDRQLEHLAEHHRVISLTQAVAELTDAESTGWVSPRSTNARGADAGSTRPSNFVTSDKPGDTGNGWGSPRSTSTGEADTRRAVVITFDDGTDDFADVVVPALDRYGLPATLYVATRFVEESLNFPWGAPPTSWAALNESRASGNITIGSHTHTHRLLDRLDPSSVADDLDRSIALIGEHLNTVPQHFAYPKALRGSTTAEILVRRRFMTAALATSRVNRPNKTDLHRLWRTPIQQSDGFETFILKANGGLRLEGGLRSINARVRYRDASR